MRASQVPGAKPQAQFLLLQSVGTASRAIFPPREKPTKSIMIAQQLAHDHPNLVRRIILLGTGPRGGEGMTFTELSAEEKADPITFLLGAFFAPTETSQTAGKAFTERLEWRREDRDVSVSKKSAEAQLNAIREWGMIPSSNRYAMLQNIKS
jgi:pimeloyl-ACP methyl ester carboxylesterase